MPDDRLVRNQVLQSARPSLPPPPGSDETRIDIDWFKVEAQTINCNGDDIERWHWKKDLAAVNIEGGPRREAFHP
jgi:hypothetical protein